jgi:hypothetical protein
MRLEVDVSNEDIRINCDSKTKKPHISVRLLAPLIDESCSYNSLIEYVAIRRLKG